MGFLGGSGFCANINVQLFTFNFHNSHPWQIWMSTLFQCVKFSTELLSVKTFSIVLLYSCGHFPQLWMPTLFHCVDMLFYVMLYEHFPQYYHTAVDVHNIIIYLWMSTWCPYCCVDICHNIIVQLWMSILFYCVII